MDLGIVGRRTVYSLHLNDRIMQLLILICQNCERPVCIFDNGRKCFDTADFIPLRRCQILVCIQRCFPFESRKLIVQACHIVIGFLIRPDNEADGIFTVVHQDPHGREIPRQLACLVVDVRQRHPVFHAFCSGNGIERSVADGRGLSCIGLRRGTGHVEGHLRRTAVTRCRDRVKNGSGRIFDSILISVRLPLNDRSGHSVRCERIGDAHVGVADNIPDRLNNITELVFQGIDRLRVGIVFFYIRVLPIRVGIGSLTVGVVCKVDGIDIVLFTWISISEDIIKMIFCQIPGLVSGSVIRIHFRIISRRFIRCIGGVRRLTVCQENDIIIFLRFSCLITFFG